MSLAPRKPQAFSHMLWFFLVPCLGFLIWASSRWINAIYLKPKTPEALSLNQHLQKIEKAKNPGDRWQAAYALSHFVQKTLSQDLWKQIPDTEKQDFFKRLANLLETQKSDHRLIKYTVLVLGQIKDPSGLSLLFSENAKNISDEINFFSAWSITEILSQKNSRELIPEQEWSQHLESMLPWLQSEDSALRKIASVFLLQFGQEKHKNESLKLLQDSDIEVQWNVIITLATLGDPRAEKLLAGLFELKNLRNVDFKSAKDIFQTLRSAFRASQKMNSPLVNAAIEKLRSEVRPQTPEGDAVLMALSLQGPQG